METQRISYNHNGLQLMGEATLLCPAAQIFVVSFEGMELFHIEYGEMGWEAIEEGLDQGLVSRLGDELMNTFRPVLSRVIEPDEKYFIIEHQGEEIICFWNADLRIRVVDSTEKLDLGSGSEQIYFGSVENDFRAFQTIDYQGETVALIEEAIEWYTSRTSGPATRTASLNPAPSFN